MSNVFQSVQSLHPGRNVFNLSYAKKMSGRMGYLYPMMCDEVVPGDVFEIGMEAVIRFAPMVAPILHEIVLKADWFFVPYRILYARSTASANGLTAWEGFITGQQAGGDLVPRTDLGVLNLSTPVPEGGLWDHLGIPPGVTLASGNGLDAPLAMPGMAYTKIWNEYYRDPETEPELSLSTYPVSTAICKDANWDADYFTRALPWQQRGTAPALPISGTAHAVWPAHDSSAYPVLQGVFSDNSPYHPFNANNKAGLEANSVDLSGATTFNVSDIRLAVQIQRWMERNARAGSRYTEFLQAHFGVSPRDDRLDRPEYIGGVRQPIIISEVLQTSKTESGAPQGNLAGHGIMAGSHFVGKYHVQEYGLIMCIMSVIPRPAYQQGINRQWLRRTRYDFYHPEFANLSEQGVYEEEIYLQAAEASNNAIFGFQGRYDEMRAKTDQVAGAFRSSLNYWHLGRIFGSAPSIGSGFTHIDATTLTRVFAVPSADHLFVHWGNKIRAIRPIPDHNNPGLMDHDFGGL